MTAHQNETGSSHCPRNFRTRRLLLVCWAILCGTSFSFTIITSSPPTGYIRSSQTLILYYDSLGARIQEESRTKSRLLDSVPNRLLVHWKGEDVEGYSLQFRHLEFYGALSAVLGLSSSLDDDATALVQFSDALNYTGFVEMPVVKRIRYNQAMQYVDLMRRDIPRKAFVEAAKRCSLVHALYDVVSEGLCYNDLARVALENGGFDDMRPGEVNGEATWCLRVRQYGRSYRSEKETRYSGRARSMKKEKEALRALKPLLIEFGGRVNLKAPDCKIYVFDGLSSNKRAVLARRMATGPRVSIIAPNTRICITNTPLCPVAAFCMCNLAGLCKEMAVLDPYAGSGAILLAAAMIEPTCRTIGIEIAHDGLVSRQDIRKDFSIRNLSQPIALLHGDSTEEAVRANARSAIGGEPFDLILCDPPYGRRESSLEMIPINELLHAISDDRRTGQRLLKKGGKLVCFVPCRDDEEFQSLMPTADQLEQAGLRLEVIREQPLNDKLSRWLVSFICIE